LQNKIKQFEFLVKHHPPEKIEFLSTKSLEPNCCEIDELDQPSEEKFWTNYFRLHRPAKLLNCINHWPAKEKWIDSNYFMTTAGYRTVPIELGKKYDSEDWSQGMFRFGEFLKEFMSSTSRGSHSGYLAQHDLFDQIPQLRKDFAIPDYCAIGRTSPVIKSWIGPANTISTMHTDDKHNLLCQVMGEKLVILASPADADKLYTYEGLLNNTSQVDPENLNVEKFPLAKNVKFLKLTLKAGEMLYIPKLWFHYVRSLTSSISVSFWFDSEECSK
jgi:Cupin-like domain